MLEQGLDGGEEGKGKPQIWRPDPKEYPGECTCKHRLPPGTRAECDPECKPCYWLYQDWLSVQ